MTSFPFLTCHPQLLYKNIKLYLVVFVCVLQSVIRCLWHPKLNQIMVGTGNGLAKVYYDPVRSHRYVQLLSLLLTQKTQTLYLSQQLQPEITYSVSP